MIEQTYWMLVNTKVNAERKVCNMLQKKRIEYYCPQTKFDSSNQFNKLARTRPLFDRLLFVQITKQQQAMVKLIDGVMNFLYWLGEPVTVKNETLTIVHRFCTENDLISVEKIAVDSYTEVQNLVEETSMVNEKGQVLKVYSKILLPSIGFVLVTELRQPEMELMQVSDANSYAFQ